MYEIISRYGYRETLVATAPTRAEAKEKLEMFRGFGADLYPGLRIQKRYEP